MPFWRKGESAKEPSEESRLLAAAAERCFAENRSLASFGRCFRGKFEDSLNFDRYRDRYLAAFFERCLTKEDKVACAKKKEEEESRIRLELGQRISA